MGVFIPLHSTIRDQTIHDRDGNCGSTAASNNGDNSAFSNVIEEEWSKVHIK